MTDITKLTKRAVPRGRPNKVPPKLDPDHAEFDFQSGEMAREYRKMMKKDDFFQFGYGSETEKSIFETACYSRATALVSEEGRDPTIKNIALAIIQNQKAEADCRAAVERWLRGGRKTSLMAALRRRPNKPSR